MTNETFEQLREVLALATGHSVDEIVATTQLDEDLGVNPEEDFPRVLAQVNQEFGIKLNPRQVLEELEEAGDTVEQLAKLIEEEVELG